MEEKKRATEAVPSTQHKDIKNILFVDSYEAEKLRKLIEKKKEFFRNAKNPTQAQMIQQEIMFLQEDILPIVLRNTMIAYSETQKYLIRCLDTAVQHKCNALLVFIPINENYTDQPIVGIANERQLSRFGTIGAIQVFCNEVEVVNMDGNKVKIQPINLPLNELL